MARLQVYNRAGYGFDMRDVRNGEFFIYTGGPSADLVSNRWFDFDTYVLSYFDGPSNSRYDIYASDVLGGSIIESIFYTNNNYLPTVDMIGINVFISNADLNSGATEWLVRMFMDSDTLIGNKYRDVIRAGNSADIVKGNGAGDRLYGERGNDELNGGRGSDQLYGGAGNDELDGDAGKDRLIGGSGNDWFIFASASDAGRGSRADEVADFDIRYDYIDVSGIDANEARPGNQTFDFIRREAFGGNSGELRFRNEILSGDTDGDGRSDFQVRVDGINSLRDIDLIL